MLQHVSFVSAATEPLVISQANTFKETHFNCRCGIEQPMHVHLNIPFIRFVDVVFLILRYKMTTFPQKNLLIRNKWCIGIVASIDADCSIHSRANFKTGS